MKPFSAGFARVNITPMRGISLCGYFQIRLADGVLDDLYADALALSCGGMKSILLSVDHLGIERVEIADLTSFISRQTGVSEDAIVIHCTHTHTAPVLFDPDYPEKRFPSVDPEMEGEYYRFVRRRLADAALAALEDLKPAKMGWGIGTAPNIAFVRRFRMKDGSVMTNPGVDNPDIDYPMGDVDERVSVVRFDREGGETLVLVHFANHPDVVGGTKVSADWPGFARTTVQQALENTKCIFFNGTQGDINHVNVHPRGGYLNDMFMDFDDVARGYQHARYLGRVVAAGVLQAFDKVQYVDVDRVMAVRKTIEIPSNMPTPEQLPEAERIHALFAAGRDHELPYTGMMLTTVVAEAQRMVKLKNGPESFPMELTGVVIGPVAMIGFPGEPFSGIGRAMKEAEGWDLVLPCCLTNGSEGYFPMQDAYDEGGYESRSSRFKAGVAEYLIAEGKQLLQSMK